MIDDDAVSKPLLGSQIVSYVLGELDEAAVAEMDKRFESDPDLKDELEEVKAHIGMHQRVRQVAPRRGSFERLRKKMKDDGSFVNAIPGCHCMLRRSFLLAMLFGAIAVSLLLVFSDDNRTASQSEVIGEIVFYNSGGTVSQRRDVEKRDQLKLDHLYDTGLQQAYLWLPTGISNTYSDLEVAQDSKFKFLDTRHIELQRGFLRKVDINPGGISESEFEIVTPHARIRGNQCRLAIRISPDGGQTDIAVAEGAVRVYPLTSEQSVSLTTGWRTTVRTDKSPEAPQKVLKLVLKPVLGEPYQFEAKLVNVGMFRFRVRKAIDLTSTFRDSIFVAYIAHTNDFDPDTGLPENVALEPHPVTPMGSADLHAGEKWLDPGSSYDFRFDISAVLQFSPSVEHWMRLEYRGDLYGPPGESRIKVESPNLKFIPHED
ncbi:hypothetical protein OAU50_08100 [Planctomycetota bacterium]|nr:hypothetical protein [Planctomycetota bacterium]